MRLVELMGYAIAAAWRLHWQDPKQASMGRHCIQDLRIKLLHF